MSISEHVFDTLNVYFLCITYITTEIVNKGFVKIELWPFSLPVCLFNYPDFTPFVNY